MNLKRSFFGINGPFPGAAGRVVIFSLVFQIPVLLPGLSDAAKIHPSAGSTSAAFLKLGVGARAVAMGGTFSGVPGDPYALYWNPAGLAYLDAERNGSFFHNEYFQGLAQEVAVYTAPASDLKFPLAGRPSGGVFGLGLNYFYTPKELERRSGLYESDPINPISPSEGLFGAYDLAFSAGYAFRSGRDVSLGAAAKVIRQSIDDRSGGSVALDLGLMRDFRWQGADYTAGISLQNLGPGIKFVSRRYDLPLSFRAGISRPIPGSGGLIAMEVMAPVDNYPSLAFGVEHPLTARLSLRSGYRYRFYGNELGAWSGFSAGAGVAFEQLSFDYAFTPFGTLGNSHRFSINFRFGKRDQSVRSAAASLASGEKLFMFSASPRALTISQRGVSYEIEASTSDCGIASLAFRTMMRGEAPAEFPVFEGGVPQELLTDLPKGLARISDWRMDSLPGNVQGDIAMRLRGDVTVRPEGAVLLYRSGGAWREARALLTDSERTGAGLFIRVPFSLYYVLAVKQ